MSTALRNELKKLRAQAKALRDRKYIIASCFMKQGETQEQALIRSGIDPALIDRVKFIRWFTAEEWAEYDKANPAYTPSDPTPPMPYPDDVEPVAWEETCRDEKPTQLNYLKDGSVV